MFGLGLTALASELCKYGYVPSEEEILLGRPDPYDDPNSGCSGVNADRWCCRLTDTASESIAPILR